MRPYRFAIAISAATSAWGLALAMKGTAERSISSLTVRNDALVARSRFPLPYRRLIRHESIEGVRLSQVLIAVAPADRTPIRGHVYVDVVGARGPLLRVPLTRDEAMRLHGAIEVACRKARTHAL
jgi:hypothetical protein